MSIDQLLHLPSYLMLQLVREARRLARNALRGPHVTVLAFLAEQEAVAQKRISDRVRMDPSDLVSVLDDLEQQGFALRKRDERDRRRFTVSITDAGRQALRERLDAARAHEEELLAPLTSQERVELTTLLRKAYLHHADMRVD
ncbi:MarR family winged helix-turn-helix transcriptional regulator [Lentzea sp. BCCO 10_0856]|uniref:MarR family winged helix-turn-helix transcriptional regulator n=1 Tax=Lentzea miocenica TaxID=3095431 RepID=A0ABU4T9Y2_9PSEU|nr:MarR family winged helix-turn-helix transcriptional regulator [Lentzea sp. BCCO 10_0856]MDX8034983.1 MarR family winged helix-turn-helix transcriptional regulator [Lentzea sp. BCCO 10_0856]